MCAHGGEREQRAVCRWIGGDNSARALLGMCGGAVRRGRSSGFDARLDALVRQVECVLHEGNEIEFWFGLGVIVGDDRMWGLI